MDEKWIIYFQVMAQEMEGRHTNKEKIVRSRVTTKLIKQATSLGRTFGKEMLSSK
jgi:hypothetical protein